MKVHLIPSDDLNKELFTRVLDLLQAVPGVNTFTSADSGFITITPDVHEEQEFPDREKFETIEHKNLIFEFHKKQIEFPHKRPSVTWQELFDQVHKYRKIHKIPKGEFALLLTPLANKKNWFAVIDEKNPFNGFIHADDWEYYLSCDPAFPIAFEVIALIMQKHIFTNYSEIRQLTHERAIGCVSDFCMKKSDIILKMRTADICPDCMQKVQKHLSGPEIHHALDIMESLRIKMLYAQNFRQNSPPSRLCIRSGGRIYLTDYSNIEIKISPMEKTLYILFLRKKERITISSLNKYHKELLEIYSEISTRGMREDLEKRIKDLTNITRDQLNVKMSRIKKAFTDAIGQTLSDFYIMQRDRSGGIFIKLDRTLFVDY